MTVLGIDPGFTGALVLVSTNVSTSTNVTEKKNYLSSYSSYPCTDPLRTWSMPVDQLDGGRQLDWLRLGSLLAMIRRQYAPDLCYLEEIPDGWSADPIGEDESLTQYRDKYPHLRKVSTTMKLAKQFGALCMGLASWKYTWHTVMPRTWQAFYGIHATDYKSTKEAAREKCAELWPEVYESTFLTARGTYHDGIGDAALIALYGQSIELSHQEVA